MFRQRNWNKCLKIERYLENVKKIYFVVSGGRCTRHLLWNQCYTFIINTSIIRFSQPGTWEAYLGLHVQQTTGSTIVKKNVKRVIPHPNYNPYTFDNDIALMELDSPVMFSDYIRPICLPAPQHDFAVGNTVWITGWGATREGGEFPQTVKYCFIGLMQNCNHKHWHV